LFTAKASPQELSRISSCRKFTASILVHTSNEKMVGRCEHRPAVSSENLAGAAVPPDAEDAIGCEIGDTEMRQRA
jgi:hypothetical protein